MDYSTLTLSIDYALKHKDPFSSFHGSNVAELTSRLIRTIEPNISLQHAELIHIGAHLHDIGKIFLSDDFLQMPRKYTSQERENMKTHVTMGHRYSHDLNLHPFIHDIILYHHENVDGTGYLNRKRREEVPWYVWVVKICDVWDALTSDRAYRKAFDRTTAIQIMQEGRGTLYDQNYLDVFLGMV